MFTFSRLSPTDCAPPLHLSWLSIVAILLILVAVPAIAANELPDIELIKDRIVAAEKDPTLTDDDRKRIIATWKQALGARQSIEALQKEIDALQRTVETAPARIRQINKQLARDAAPTKVPKTDSPEVLQKLLQQESLRLASLRDKAKQAEQTLSDWNDRRRGLRKLISETRSKLEQMSEEINDLKSSNVKPDDPHLMALRLQKKQRELELRLAEQQLGNEQLLSDLYQAESDLAQKEAAQLDKYVNAIKDDLQSLIQAKGDLAVEQAETDYEKVTDAPAAVKQLAQKNIRLSQELKQTLEANTRSLRELQQLKQEINDLLANEKAVHERLELFGATDAMGRLLRKRLEQVRSIRRSSQIRDEQAQLTHFTDRKIDIDEQLEELRDLNKAIDQEMQKIPPEIRNDPVKAKQLREQTQTLLKRKRALLESLADAYEQYTNHLVERTAAERRYQEISHRFEEFMRGQLFWMRNTTPVNFKHLKDKFAAAGAILSPTRLSNSLIDIQQGFRSNPVLPASGLLLGLFLLLTQPRANRQITEIGRNTALLQENRFYHTLLGLWYTLWRSAGWPVLLGFTGWWLGRIPSAEPYTAALSEGLYTMATVLFTIDFFRQICRANGLAHRHFHWPNAIRRKLWTELRWLKFIVAPLSFLIAFTLAVEFTPLIPAVGRPALILMMLALVVFTWRMLNAQSPLTRYLQAKRPRHWVTQTRFLWFPLLMITPLTLAILSILGYHYTAGLLTQRLLYTIWLFIFLLLVKNIFLRWIFIEKRRIAWEEAVKRREEMLARLSGGSTEDYDSEVVRLEQQDSVEFYEQLSAQAQHIIGAILLLGGAIGFWAIWSDLLPALKFLENITLPFTRSVTIDGITTEVPLTLADAGIGALVIIITILAARNIPGLLEILILQRLPINAGSRYAITTLSQYTIVAIGLITTFSLIGIQWSKIQWLVAALSVGLGFGLQEIVANFISGIILLFERPIRVGDVVTVGDTTGTVSRIQIRATTIRNWDRQELLVPNKEFVTGRLLNWTLTDPINRVTIDVGIAYGSDVELALKLLREAALESSHVLKDPEPLISFEEFGDSALLLRMRCYLDSMEFRTMTRSEVNANVNRKLNDAGIVIAFPQMDVHLDTNSALELKVAPDDRKGKDKSD